MILTHLFTFTLFFIPVFVFGQDSKGLIPCAAEGCDSFADVVDTVNYIIKEVITISPIFAGILFGYAGFLFMTAQDNPGQVEKAKSVFTQVFIGYLIILMAWLIVNQILVVLGAKNYAFQFLGK